MGKFAVLLLVAACLPSAAIAQVDPASGMYVGIDGVRSMSWHAGGNQDHDAEGLGLRFFIAKRLTPTAALELGYMHINPNRKGHGSSLGDMQTYKVGHQALDLSMLAQPVKAMPGLGFKAGLAVMTFQATQHFEHRNAKSDRMDQKFTGVGVVLGISYEHRVSDGVILRMGFSRYQTLDYGTYDEPVYAQQAVTFGIKSQF